MARENTTRPVHFPFNESEVSVVFEEKVQDTFIGFELARTLTVPLPLQLPSRDFRNSASLAWAPVPIDNADIAKIIIARGLIMIVLSLIVRGRAASVTAHYRLKPELQRNQPFTWRSSRLMGSGR